MSDRSEEACPGQVPVPSNMAEIRKAALRQPTKTPMPMQDP
jgi:L-lactate utilization protein LutB